MQDTLQINGLEPIIAPDPVSFWPPAPGWYVLAVIALLLVFYGVYLLIRKYQKNLYRRLALQELATLELNTNSQQIAQSIASLNTLLKRTALAGYPRDKVASLSGKDWLAFLEKTCPTLRFTDSPGKLLAEIAYIKEGADNIQNKDWQELLSMCKQWIRHHRA